VSDRAAGVRSVAGVLMFALIFSLSLTFITAWSLYAREMAFGARARDLLATFAAGSFVGSLLAWFISNALARRRPDSARFAAMLLALTTGTSGTIAFFYFLQYRSYFSDFHDNFPSVQWMFQMLFTGATAAYTFTVSGLPLILPLGLIPLFLGAAWYTRVSRG
jgi:hypothetical protein